jgi:hypothetical protein
MYLPDLSTYPATSDLPTMLAIGWLDCMHPFETAPPSSAFLTRLEAFCVSCRIASMGIHDCEFCSPELQRGYIYAQGSILGSAEIVIFGRKGTKYIAPNLIYHYVQAHHYNPPSVFQQAVLASASPSSRAYNTRLSREVLLFMAEPKKRQEILRRLDEETAYGRLKWRVRDRIAKWHK